MEDGGKSKWVVGVASPESEGRESEGRESGGKESEVRFHYIIVILILVNQYFKP